MHSRGRAVLSARNRTFDKRPCARDNSVPEKWHCRVSGRLPDRRRGRRGTPWFRATKAVWRNHSLPLSSLDAHFYHKRALSANLRSDRVNDAQCVSCSNQVANDIYMAIKRSAEFCSKAILPAGDMLILGFGINVNIHRSEFPPDLQPVATSLAIETKQHSRVTPSRINYRHYCANRSIDQAAAHARL